MFQYEADEVLAKLSEQKGLIVSLDRSIRDLRHKGKGSEAKPEAPGSALVAGIAAKLARKANNTPLADVLQTKATVPIATTTAVGWAVELSNAGLPGLVLSLQGRSATASILARSPQVSLLEVGRRKITVGGAVPPATIIAEGSPIPAFRGALAPLTLSPVKLAAIVGLSDELVRSSEIEAVTRAMLSESVATGLDAAFFSTTAPGILNGLSPIASSTATDPHDALLADLSNLLKALTAPSPETTFVMSPSNYVVATALLGPSFGYAVAQSSGLAAETVVAVDPLGVAAAFGEERSTLSDAATIHEFDTPTSLSVVGTPNTIAAPTRSYFQTDSTGVKLVAPIAWAARAGSVAHLIAAAW